MAIGLHVFKIGEHTYRAGRLSTFDQLEIATTCRQAFFNLALLEKQSKDDNRPIDDFGHAQALCGFMGMLPREVRDPAVRLCLTVVARARGKNNANWDPALQGEQFMFNDLDVPDLLQIVYEVVKHNGLIRFFSVSPAEGEKDGTETTSQS